MAGAGEDRPSGRLRDRANCAARRSRRRGSARTAVGDHGAGAAEAFLGRLEDEDRRALEVPRLGEVARRAEQHGGVAVMAAAVESCRRMVERQGRLVDLVHRQRIHVGAQADAAAGPAACLRRMPTTPVLADAAMCTSMPQERELLGDDVGGPDLLEADLGMGVESRAGWRSSSSAKDVECSGRVGHGRNLQKVGRLSRRRLAERAQVRRPGRRRRQGRAAGSTGIGPGAAQTRIVSAIGSKSARKCTELLLTRIACSRRLDPDLPVHRLIGHLRLARADARSARRRCAGRRSARDSSCEPP
jgi:hypothetical protein